MNFSKPINVLSLFDGISCGMVALDKLGIKVHKYVAYEIDHDAIIISKKNHPHIQHEGNVFNANFNHYVNFDLLLGGSPCEYWSIGNKNREIYPSGKGWDFFKQYCKALSESKCKFFLYENNSSIHPNIINAISKELGVLPIMINSKYFSAQQRKRLYWTNIPIKSNEIFDSKNKSFSKELIPENCSSYMVKDILVNDSKQDNLFGFCQFNSNHAYKEYVNASLRIGKIGKGGQGQRVYSVNGKSITLTSRSGGKGGPTGLYLTNSSTVRKLLPLEAERLQTLPDNYTETVDNTKRYQLIGSGWTIDVISYILKPLFYPL